MPIIETVNLVIELPNDWVVFDDHGQIVAHGPEEAELIGSLVIISGAGSKTDQNELIELTRLRVEKSMQSNVAESALKVTSVLSSKTLTNGIRLSQLFCQSSDGLTAFDQYVLTASAEVFFVTYEGSASATSTRDLVRNAIETTRLK